MDYVVYVYIILYVANAVVVNPKRSADGFDDGDDKTQF